MIEYSNGSHADFQPSGGNLHFGVVPLEAIATASGHAQSNVGSAAYTINLPVVVPRNNPSWRKTALLPLNSQIRASLRPDGLLARHRMRKSKSASKALLLTQPSA
ncbi:MAG: hypothetical protein ABSA48_05870 [Terracidiphilus sp.]|jgi:hypothetical protein